MKEIITIQVGGFSNYIGSHFWNFQDELIGLAEDANEDPVFRSTALNMDMLYRMGKTCQGAPTYTPRLLVVDSRGSLGAIHASGFLDEETLMSSASSIPTWDGRVTRHVSEPYEKNKFLQSLEEEEEEEEEGKELNTKAGSHANQNGCGMQVNKFQNKKQRDKERIESLENGVQYWTDYSKVQFHPSSLYEIQGLWKDVTPFEDYGCGRGFLRESSQVDELSDRIRFFVEECDHMQGFQFLVDDSGGFASVGVDILEIMADEYACTPIILYSARDPSSYSRIQDTKSFITKGLHDAISFTKLSTLSRLIVPVGLPSLAKSEVSRLLSINDSKLFHSSAVYAAAFHTASLPFRIETSGPLAISEFGVGGLDMGVMIEILSHRARQQQVVASLDAAIPAPPVTGAPNWGLLTRSLQPLTPNVANVSSDAHGAEILVIQGALHSGRGGHAFVSEVKDSLYGAYQGPAKGHSVCHLCVSPCPLPIPLPFPCIFGNSICQHGEILSSPIAGTRAQGATNVFSIPMATRLRSSNAILPFLEKRLRDLQRLGTARGAAGGQVLERWGFQKDEVQDLSESLAEMVLAFDNASTEVSSDSD